MQLSKRMSMMGATLGAMTLASLVQTASAETYQSGQEGKTTLDFTAKSTTTTSTKTGHEPMDLIQIVDYPAPYQMGNLKAVLVILVPDVSN